MILQCEQVPGGWQVVERDGGARRERSAVFPSLVMATERQLEIVRIENFGTADEAAALAECKRQHGLAE